MRSSKEPQYIRRLTVNFLLGVFFLAIYTLPARGQTLEILHDFFSRGVFPSSGVIQASDGNLYGTTLNGGVNNQGTVFRTAPDGSDFQQLHLFLCGADDGCFPFRGRLIQASDGNLYGTTLNGGPFNVGTVFRIALDGLGFQLIHSFQCVTEGCSPGGLIQASDGNLYGIIRAAGNLAPARFLRSCQTARVFSSYIHFNVM